MDDDFTMHLHSTTSTMHLCRHPSMATLPAALLELSLVDEAQIEAERASALAHAVLFSPDLWLELWPWFDRGSKRALRGVCVAMCSQVDGSITAVTSPAGGVSPEELIAALVKCPRVHDLTLLHVASTSELAPLATTSLAGLKSLTVRQVGTWRMGAWAHVDRHGRPMQLSCSLPAAVDAACMPRTHGCMHGHGVVARRSLARGPRVGRGGQYTL
jgi:hypothetical protein